MIGHTTDTMTEKYFHLSAGAASAAIESLPAMTGNQPAALPAHNGDIREQVRALAETLNAQNWKAVKVELLKL